jgi:glyoxylase-like metal-dependent hydrolase (beta-lactamase superfamily II)
LLVVDLPGHAAGQIGLLVRAGLRERYFLVADACWGERSYRELRSPNPIVRAIFDDWGAYKETLGKIQSLSVSEPTIKIVPCHCDQTLAELTPSPSSVGHVHV